LVYLTGISEQQTILAGEISTLPDEKNELSPFLKEAENRPDVEAAKENLKVVKAELLAAEGGYAPTLSLQGDYILKRQGNGNTDNPRWDAFINASLPIFTGGQTEGRVREYKSKVRQAELQIRRTLRSAQEEIRQSFTAYHNALKQDAAYQKALAAAEKSHRAQEADYRLHLTNIVQYLQSLTDLEQARLNAAKSRYQWRIQRVWLGVASGQLPRTDQSSSSAETHP
jgi:outer membrane protein